MGCCPAFWQAVWDWLGWGKKKAAPKKEDPPQAFVMPSFVEEQPVYTFENRPWITASTYSPSPVANSVSPDPDSLYLPPEHGSYYDADELSFREDPRGLVEYSLSPPDVVIEIPPPTPPPAPVEIIYSEEEPEVREWVDVGGWWAEGVDTPPPPPSTNIPESPLEV